MSGGLRMGPAGVGEVAAVLDGAAAALDGPAETAAQVPDAGDSTVVVAELMAAMSGAVGVYVEALGVAGALVAEGGAEMQRVEGDNVQALGGIEGA